ncbi:Binding-protein-dependent transport system inner membrane component [Acididesulfobacillus acetoxydans]|uniref:Glutathione transport system permease protein GsiC n=1 Tax=Acididesulfobacillus acetoxydans TaxID=1561005 RepID=A0A8S0Y2P4_9FIRM|nr:glutathione ABC transporter permease GsiC [Acididesulfobacillus acetoxydans]CAA7601055.1 Binding-protein-dependent transport system inner membrane component [Acididesulfobacillus acetoxydans]CEJ06929.1 Glutathione transport system permease protein GsiC [Acididesulfobacillus acetoxydans]
MLKFIVRRLLGMIPILFVVSVLIFSFVRMIPGDPARLAAGPDASYQDIQAVRAKLGLDKPMVTQYLIYVKGLLHGNLGTSLKSGRPVTKVIGSRFMATFWLTVASMAWAFVIGLFIGVLSAVKRNKWQDYAGMFSAVSGISLPAFWLGLMLIQVFSVQLGWLPTGGFASWQSLILPSLTLGSGVAAVIARFTRSSLMEVLKEDYTRTARAKGLPPNVIVWKHALRNALVPVVTMTGLQFGFLLGGSVVVETVFSWPGLGRLLIDSVAFRDYPTIQGEMLLFALEFILINLVVDVLYALLNPQIRLE